MFMRLSRTLAFPYAPRLGPFGVQNPPKFPHRGLRFGRVQDDVMRHGRAHVRMSQDRLHGLRIRPQAASDLVETANLADFSSGIRDFPWISMSCKQFYLADKTNRNITEVHSL
jgi:hypothetical protein